MFLNYLMEVVSILKLYKFTHFFLYHLENYSFFEYIYIHVFEYRIPRLPAGQFGS